MTRAASPALRRLFAESCRGHLSRQVVRTRRWYSDSPSRPRTAIFFPGQGVQKVGMLTPWLEAFPSTAKQLVDEIDSFMGYKLSDVIQKGPPKVLTRTTNAQPAIMATSILILRILEKEFGFRISDHVDVALGHSLGEFAALVAGGHLTFQDSLYLVQKRAEAMSEATRKAIKEYGGEYGMVAIITEPEYMPALIETVRGFVGGSDAGNKAGNDEDVPPIEQVLIANINSKNQIVLSGNLERIKTLIAHIRQFLGHDPRAVQLHSDSPFHSPIMKPAVAVMRSLLNKKSRVPGRENEDIVTYPAQLQCISNITARPFKSKEDLKDLLARGCLDTVRWWDSIRYLDQEERVRRWVGIGPGMVGRNLVGKEVGMRGKDMVKGGGVWAITDPLEVEEVLRGLEDTRGIMDEEEVLQNSIDSKLELVVAVDRGATTPVCVAPIPGSQLTLQPQRSPSDSPSKPHDILRHDHDNTLDRLHRRHRAQRRSGQNNPLHISIFPSYDAATNSFAPIRTPLQFSLLLSSTIDVFELRAKHNAVSGDFGLLHAVDDRLAAYGAQTNTGVRLVCVVDMRGRRIGSAAGSLPSSAAPPPAVSGLREAELKPAFRAMQNAYVRLLQNPFFEPDEHTPLGGRGGRKITSRRFAEDMKRIGEGWTPGVTNLG
ncbi:hypothetical protein S7711_07359 [Stachybotrys chartarum IBT 7711]|uniref:[acyl-carrier-protein] S-malonyltransferase n=1 Tax=Stachybotrys chartarum (strain CBS 109288 / IBT 7711) TaxID=1280523 RepID=A0A084AI94_STACB|nr:hypothetical protein S7711_07359 [Stachybotrys chartarum IBT 7711]